MAGLDDVVQVLMGPRADLVDRRPEHQSGLGEAEERSRYPGTATVVVSDLAELMRRPTAHGGRITVPESTPETGRFLYARHADGAEVEYVQWRPEVIERILG